MSTIRKQKSSGNGCAAVNWARGLVNFRLEETAVPVPQAGQVLLRTLYLSLDPYMRGRMSDTPSYAPPVPLGEVMVGATVSRVEVSRHAECHVGELVLGYNGWQDKWQRHQQAQAAFADKTEMAEDVSCWHPHNKGQQGGKGSLPDGESQRFNDGGNG
ncbi:MAG: hypothetical protein HGA82_01035, partial [Anaerolineales bacterium]|nr:hypothetical protein [Anaerolineales bacterium]